ncbi:R2 Retrovirus-related Pol polyprotein from type I retrotransposable element [Triplophysa tibetana]|uniref:R2 Retrovirus-related Pol polyprotein from type I retrotransposable element n=1 Tax=Triplophysa tibetana TaxID=1572043 RepID=A0A5A9PCE8_9TELE|nr:R2 Retrovirus-related Pol polyprotein from type I retrotransposable element [Triplophysa tibetana]
MVSDLDTCGTSSASPGDQLGHLTRMLSTFERESCGPFASAKRRDNARQRARRTQDLFEFCRRTYGPHFFDTMPPTDGLLGFLTGLYGRNLIVSTVRHYLIDIRFFCSYAADSSEREASVTEAKLRHLKRACMYQMNQMRGDVHAHRAEIRAAKSKFPRMIEAFAREPTLGVMFRLQGLLSGYMSILTGHRRCVLINMTAVEVGRAGTTQDRFRVISVKHNKTAAFFGEAKVTLSPVEYTWMTDIISHRSVVSEYAFCTAQGNRCMVLLSHFRVAWRRLGLPERLDFMMIRDSIITHAHVRQSRRQRECLARALCHNMQTALRYYVADQTDDLARTSSLPGARAPAPGHAEGRGRSRSKGQCQECPYTETLNHILQSCARTHDVRCVRHNRVVRLVCKKLHRGEYTTLIEPIVPCLKSHIKPDIIVHRTERLVVMDITVVAGHRLKESWDLKIRKYGSEDSLEAMRSWWGSEMEIDHLPVVISGRGVNFGPSGRGLRRLGFSTRDIMDICLCAVQGSLNIYDTYMRGN